MTRILLSSRAIFVMVAAILSLTACSSSPDADAPGAIKPVIASVERHYWINEKSSWGHLSRIRNKYLVGFATSPIPPSGVPTFAVSFTGPLLRSNYAVNVGDKAAVNAETHEQQAAAEASGSPWFYQDHTVPRRLVVRVPNELLLSGGETTVSVFNVSRNPSASRKERKSEPMVFTIVVGPNQGS